MAGTDASITIARDNDGTRMSVQYDAKISRRQFFEVLSSQKDVHKLQFFHDSTRIKLCDIVRCAPALKILLYGNDCDRTREGIAASEIALSAIEELYLAWNGRCFPKWIFSLPKLKKLELSCPEMKSLPKEILTMPKLEELNLIWCPSLLFRLNKMKKIKSLKWIYATAFQMHHFQYSDLDNDMAFAIEMPKR